MNRTLRAVLGIAGLYGSAFAATVAFQDWYRPSLFGVDSMTAALLAVPLAASVGYVVGAVRYVQEERLVLRSIAQPDLKDGHRVALEGVVEPLGPALRSPFTGTECVAYQYEIQHQDTDADGGPTWARDYWGMAVSPYHLVTPAGSIRVLGYARLETFSEHLAEEACAAAEAYVRATAFRHPSSPGERLGSLAEPLATESDTFQDDICTDTSHSSSGVREPPPDLRGRRLTERRLDVGQTACAAGCYSAAKGALVPTSSGVRQLRLSTFSLHQWAAENRQWALTDLRWGVGLGVLAVGAALATRWC